MDHHIIIASFGLEGTLEIIIFQWVLLDGQMDVLTPRGAASLGAELCPPQFPAGDLQTMPRGCLPKGRVPHPGVCRGLLTHVIAPGMFFRAGGSWHFYPGPYQLIKPWVSRCLSVGAVCSARSGISSSPVLPQLSLQESGTQGQDLRSKLTLPCSGVKGYPRAAPGANESPLECSWLFWKSWVTFWCHHRLQEGCAEWVFGGS